MGDYVCVRVSTYITRTG